MPIARDAAAAEVTADVPDADAGASARDAARQAEAVRATALDLMPDPFLLLEPVRAADGSVADFRCVDANAAAATFLDRAREDVIGALITGFLVPENQAAAVAACARLLRGGTPLSLEAEPLMSRTAGGATRRFDIRAAAVEGRVAVVWRDVTDRVESAGRLAASQSQYQLLADHASDVVMLADDRLQVRWVSPSARRVLGRPAGDLLGGGALALVHPDDLPILRRTVDEANRTAGDTRLRFRWKCGDGEYRWMEAVGRYVADQDAEGGGRVVHVRDVDDQVRVESSMASQARTDALTGLLNRAEALSRLQAILAHPPRRGHQVGVLFCDLDGLKSVNDRYGHAAGDQLLIMTAERLSATVREHDLVARIGGDEFLIVLTGVGDIEGLTVVADRIRRAAAAPLPGRAERPAVASTISIGIALARLGDGVDDVIARADAAMYAAKQAGGDATATSPASAG